MLNSLARTLRPICRMLSVELPAILRPPAPKPRPPRKRPAKPAPPPPLGGKYTTVAQLRRYSPGRIPDHFKKPA